MRWSVLLCACASAAPVPGAELLGTFGLLAEQRQVDCSLAEVTGFNSFTFAATYSRDPASQTTFLSLRGNSNAAVFDGQVVRSQVSAIRQFSACANCTSQLQEELQLALLSESQSKALQGQCPQEAPLGSPVVDADAGIVAPGRGAFAFDSTLACGLLNLSVSSVDEQGTSCAVCASCRVQYRVTGSRL